MNIQKGFNRQCQSLIVLHMLDDTNVHKSHTEYAIRMDLKAFCKNRQSAIDQKEDLTVIYRDDTELK